MNMKEKSLFSLLDGQKNLNGNKTAIRFAGQDISYDEFMNSVNTILQEVRQKGQSKEAIIIATGRKPQMIAAMVAVVESGNYYVPIDYLYPQGRIDYIVSHCKARVVITDEDHKMMFPGHDLIVLKERFLENCEVKIDEDRVHDIAYSLYTSGSTGNPKGVLIPEDALINFVYGMKKTIPLEGVKTILCASTQCFDIFFLESIMALSLGITVCLTETEDGTNPKRLMNLIRENHVDALQMTPSRVAMIKEYDPSLTSFRELKVIMIGGEPFPEALLKDLKQNTDARIFNMYGPTETTIWSSVAELTDSEEIHIGTPILNTTFYVMKDDSHRAEDGEAGELCIGGAGLSRGYLFDPEKTSQRYVDYEGERIYKTGDSVSYDREKNLYKVHGRLDNQIKLNGFRIELEEIENICSNIGKIKQVVIYPYKEDGAVKKLIMFYTASEEIDKGVITEYLSKYLPDYMIPAEFERVEKFEYTDNGKIDRKKITYAPKTEKHVEEVEGEDAWNLFRKIFLEISDYAVSREGTEELKDIIDSLHFVKFIVAIEDEYDFEIDDEYLDIKMYDNVLDFFHKVCELISNK